MRKESNHLFSITQGIGEFVEEYMSRFRKENLEIVYCPSSIVI